MFDHYAQDDHDTKFGVYTRNGHNLEFSKRGQFFGGRGFSGTTGFGNAIRSEVAMPSRRSAVPAIALGVETADVRGAPAEKPNNGGQLR